MSVTRAQLQRVLGLPAKGRTRPKRRRPARPTFDASGLPRLDDGALPDPGDDPAAAPEVPEPEPAPEPAPKPEEVPTSEPEPLCRHEMVAAWCGLRARHPTSTTTRRRRPRVDDAPAPTPKPGWDLANARSMLAQGYRLAHVMRMTGYTAQELQPGTGHSR
jgi:hypothetical protein